MSSNDDATACGVRCVIYNRLERYGAKLEIDTGIGGLNSMREGSNGFVLEVDCPNILGRRKSINELSIAIQLWCSRNFRFHLTMLYALSSSVPARGKTDKFTTVTNILQLKIVA